MDHMDQFALIISLRNMCCRTTVMWSVLKICRMLQELRIIFLLFHAKTYDTFRNTTTEGQHLKMKTLA